MIRTLAAILVSLALASNAWAGDVEEAKAAFERAERAYRLRDFERALEGYRAAYAAYPKPELLFNIGQAQRGLHRWRAAIFSFELYLRDAPDAPDRAEVEALIARLEREASRADAARVAAKPKVAPPPPPPPPSAPPPPIVADAPREDEDAPIFEKWWFWTAAGAVVLAGAVTGVVLAADGEGGPPGTLGRFDYR